jgi:fumarate reductase subunit C
VSARLETWLWFAQRLSAMVLAVAVAVHLGTIVYAVQGGLDGAEIVARVAGNGGWLAFYVVFAAAAAVHAPIGLRAVLVEMTPLPARAVDVLVTAAVIGIAWTGWSAAYGLYGLAGT